MQTVARAVGLGGIATLFLACAMAAPAAAIEVKVPTVHIPPPKVTPTPQVHTPTSPTVKGSVSSSEKGSQ